MNKLVQAAVEMLKKQLESEKDSAKRIELMRKISNIEKIKDKNEKVTAQLKPA